MKKIYFYYFIPCLFFVGSILSQKNVHSSLNEPLQLPPNCLVLTLEKAVSQALTSNRQLLGTVESLTQAQYGIDLAESEFNLSITPNSQAGYIGRDRGKPIWTAGGGIDFSKKFSTGTLISVVPSIVKRNEHYLTEIQTTVAQPLLRGLGKEYQLANMRGAQFNYAQRIAIYILHKCN